MIVKKPWGDYTDIHRTENVVFKKITIKPGQSISYQMHNLRSEFWYLISGKGQLKISTSNEPLNNFSVQTIIAGESIEIPTGVYHKITNIDEHDDLIIYEMQYGNCYEEDILRIQDDYNR